MVDVLRGWLQGGRVIDVRRRAEPMAKVLLRLVVPMAPE